MNTTITTITTKTIRTDRLVLLSKKGMKELKKSTAQLEHDRAMAIRGLHDIDKTTGHDDRLERVERLARLESIESELSEKHQTILEARLVLSPLGRHLIGKTVKDIVGWSSGMHETTFRLVRIS
jgi:hypothetical protein